MNKKFLAAISIFLLGGGVSDVRSPDYWITLSVPTQRSLTRMQFLDSLAGWVSGAVGTIIMTSNGGSSWEVQNTNTNIDILDISMISHRSGWALGIRLPDLTGEPGRTVMFKTLNGGATWDSMWYPTPDKFFYSISFLDSLHGWMGGEFGTMVGTSDGGASWFEAAVDTPAYPHFAIRRIKFFSPSHGIAVGGAWDLAGVIWRTTNGGALWSVISIGSEPLNGIHYWDSLNIICVGGDADFGPTMVRTTNGGEDWEYSYVGFLGEARAIAFRTPTEAWVPLGFSATYMFSFDNTETWRTSYIPNLRAAYDVLFIDPMHGYMVGSYGMVLKFNPTALGVVRDSVSILPTETILSQNFPNPFNPSTTITYRVPSRSMVAVEIYDVAGRKVQTLKKGVQEAGSYSLRFNAEGRPSGIYLCTVRVELMSGSREVFIRTTKMVLLK